MAKFKYAIGHAGRLHKFEADHKQVVMVQAIDFMKKNNIKYSESELSAAIDRQSKILTAPKKLTLADAIHGAKAVLKYTTGASASTDEILRRSKICADCPLRSKVGGCMSCGAAGAIARFVNTVRSTMKVSTQIPSEVRSHYCNHCGCSLALIVVSKMDAFSFENDTKNNQRPDMCWLKRTSTSYIP